jgi:hypothetical protein
MKFNQVDPCENYDRLKLRSEGGRWELGLRSMIYGVRVRFGRTGEGYCSLDYCAGASPIFQMELINAIHIILLEVSEDIHVCDLEHMFPRYEIKPINLDPVCWPELVRMRDAARERLGIQDEFVPLFQRHEAA